MAILAADTLIIMHLIIYKIPYEFYVYFWPFQISSFLTNDKWGRVDGKNTVGEKS